MSSGLGFYVLFTCSVLFRFGRQNYFVRFGQNSKTLLRSVTNWHVYIFWFIFFLSYLFWTVYNLKSQYICPIQYHSYFEIFLVSIKVRHTDILHHSDDLKREKFDPSELQFRGGATMHCMYFLFFFFDEWILKIF